MEIRLVLVSESGRIIGRQEIADQVWGKGICPDGVNRMNGSIRKVRQVSRDDPEQPLFVQRGTGRGYGFIAPVATDGSFLGLLLSFWSQYGHDWLHPPLRAGSRQLKYAGRVDSDASTL